MNALVPAFETVAELPTPCALPVRRWSPGQVIDQPGLYSDVPISIYHGQPCAGPSASSSGLRTLFSKSPAHFFNTSSLNPDRVEQDDNPAFILGRAAHHVLLGEREFAKHFVVRPEELAGAAWHGNRKDCRAWLAEAQVAGLTVLTGKDIDAIKGMSRSLAAEPLIQAGAMGGLIEHSMFYQDPATGIWIKVRPDAIPTDAVDFSDLKTTTSVVSEDVDRTIGDFGYHMQGALVGMACRAVLGVEMSSFTLIFVEKSAPHCVAIRTLTPEDLALGELQVRTALDVMARCIDKGRWPGPAGDQTDAAYARLPPWVREKAEHRISTYQAEYAL